MKRYGNKRRTQAEKRAAALQFVVMADKSPAEKAAALVRSYGFSEPDAEAFVARHGRAA